MSRIYLGVQKHIFVIGDALSSPDRQYPTLLNLEVTQGGWWGCRRYNVVAGLIKASDDDQKVHETRHIPIPEEVGVPILRAYKLARRLLRDPSTCFRDRIVRPWPTYQGICNGALIISSLSTNDAGDYLDEHRAPRTLEGRFRLAGFNNSVRVFNP